METTDTPQKNSLHSLPLTDDDNEIEQEGHGADATPSPLNISDVNENLSGSHHPNTSS